MNEAPQLQGTVSPSSHPTELYTAAQACEYLGICPRTLAYWHQKGGDIAGRCPLRRGSS